MIRSLQRLKATKVVASKQSIAAAATTTSTSNRCFSSSDGSFQVRERKRRFYAKVNVEPCGPPWEDPKQKKTISTGVSAGVDGTDSASGVFRVNENNISDEKLKQVLVPRSPGVEYDSKNSFCDWHTVTLDGRALKTPMGRTLALPSKNYAFGVAAEWNNVSMIDPQKMVVSNRHFIIPTQMPFMTLACTAIDQTASATAIFQEQILRFLHTDTVCYWADPVEDRVLYGRQQNAWTELHDWIGNEFAPDPPAMAIGHMEGMMLAKGQRGLGHSPALVKFCEDWIMSLDAWHLTALHSICSEAKSFLIGAAVLMRHMQADAAMKAARVEEEFNIENWGLVEGGHDYDRLNGSIQIRSAALLVEYLAK